MNKQKTCAIIIPAFNEIKRLKKLVKRIRKYSSNIIVVNDGSVDDTESTLKKEKIIQLRHIINLGKGAAVKTGIEYAIKRGYKSVVIMDADGQHDPVFIPKFISLLDSYDFVAGYRSLDFAANKIRFLGNWINRNMIELLFQKRVADPLCGFRGFNLKIYPEIKWESTGYGIETEMMIRIIKNKIRFIEFPISTIYFDKYKGVSILDAYKVFFDMIKWKISI